MSGDANNFSLLIELAKEHSSEKRRELLRKVTDTFLAATDSRTIAKPNYSTIVSALPILKRR